MIVYADASMLVKRYLIEAESDQVRSILAPPASIGTALITRAEVSPAIATATRMGLVTDAAARQALNEFRSHWQYLLRLRLTEAITAQADALAWAHGLRGYDAVHLATALTWQAALDEPITLGTYDRQLWAAGQNTGLAVWPPSLT